MQLVSIRRPPGIHVAGLVVGDEVVDLSDPAVGLPRDLRAVLELGATGLEAAAGAVSTTAARFPLDEVALGPPVPDPSTFLGIGMNYAGHVAEMGRQPPAHQYWFTKQRSCVAGPGDPIPVPSISEQVDYEGELGIVIGRRCRNVPASRAMEVVAGFTIVNDVSVRDLQAHSPTFTMGKSFDGHGPMGPLLVTPDEVGDPEDLLLQTWVNGELRQHARTDDLLFGCAQMIEYLTSVFWLSPGDVLATGTPAGVAAGKDPSPWLRPGDVVRIRIEGLGILENPVVAGGAPVPEGLDG